TGLRVQSGGSAGVFNSTIRNQHLGVLVDGGKALLQGDNLDGNTAGGGNDSGLQVQNGAIVDAGQLSSAAGYYGDVTGLGIRSGGNSFAGYTADTSGQTPSVPQAIRNLNTGTAPFSPGGEEQSNNYSAAGPQLGRMDLTAQNNTFGAATQLFQIEQVIFHDLDDTNFGFVTYGTAPAISPKVIAPGAYHADFRPPAPKHGAGTM